MRTLVGRRVCAKVEEKLQKSEAYDECCHCWRAVELASQNAHCPVIVHIATESTVSSSRSKRDALLAAVHVKLTLCVAAADVDVGGR